MNNLIKKFKKFMTPFQWFEVLGVIAFTVYFAIIDNQHSVIYNIINAFAAICGIFCVVLCAGAKKSQYYWGTINIVAYVIIAWINRLYGEVMLNALYYFPSQFIGIYLWKKHENSDDGFVKCRKMKPIIASVMIGACALCIWLYKMLLQFLGGNSVWLDSASTVVSIFANALMILRYREQWILWIVVDAVTVMMWSIQKDWIMTSMWAFYLLNAIYGLLMWSRKNKESNSENR